MEKEKLPSSLMDRFLLRIHEWIEELRIAYEKFMVYLREELQSLESEVDGNGRSPLDLIPSKHSSFFQQENGFSD
jgi:hypothetical protein